jgi:hypothetical protein
MDCLAKEDYEDFSWDANLGQWDCTKQVWLEVEMKIPYAAYKTWNLKQT